MNILLVDDDAFNREGVRLFFEQKGYNVIEAGTSEEGWDAAQATKPAGAIIDIVMPISNKNLKVRDDFAGVNLAIRLKKQYPYMGIVLFSAHDNRGEQIVEFVRNGHSGIGYKLKGCSPSSLLNSLKRVMEGHVELDKDVTNRRAVLDAVFANLPEETKDLIKKTSTNLSQLSPREYQIAMLLAASYTNQKIGEELNISSKTVENHITNTYKRLDFDLLEDRAPHLRKSMLLANAIWYKEISS